MKKIIITAPKNSGKWKVSAFGSTGKHRALPTTVFQLVERQLFMKKNLSSVRKLKEKTAIRVNYGQGNHNESLLSDNTDYLLYTLIRFLEDYLPAKTFSKQYEKYSNYEL